MDPLDRFEFDAVDDTPGLFAYEEQPIEHTHLVRNLERASAANDLPVVEETFETRRYTQASPRLLTKPGHALQIAIDYGHAKVVQCLLSKGVEISAMHVRSATTAQARPLIELYYSTDGL